MTVAGAIILGLILARWAAQLWLDSLNRRHVLGCSDTVPNAFRGIIDEPTYFRSIQYTLAKGRLNRFDNTYETLILVLVLFSGVLPWSHDFFAGWLGTSAWAMAAWLLAVGMGLGVTGLPAAWYAQFRLEERFGFNTTTVKIWWLDRFKGLLLSLLLGYPLLVLILKMVEWSGVWWWFWAWCVLMAFQVLMAVLAPVLILPLFNKFTPLPEGSLRDRLLALARRTRFRTANIQVMDGSKRSRHSNAFFTGFGRYRKIVLFDTLIRQLSEPELESVLAHEIGHFRKRHIHKMLVVSGVLTLAGFFVLSLLARQSWFFLAFGFQEGIAPALLLFALLSGVVTFWFSPLAHWWSRTHEYEADAFAADTMNESQSLVGALRKLNEKNLSNLTPHPVYSGFYYSHPTLLERETRLKEKTQG